MNASVECTDICPFLTESHIMQNQPKTQICYLSSAVATLINGIASVRLATVAVLFLASRTRYHHELTCTSSMGWTQVESSQPWTIIVRIAIRRPHLYSYKRARRRWKIWLMPQSVFKSCHHRRLQLLREVLDLWPKIQLPLKSINNLHSTQMKEVAALKPTRKEPAT